MGENYHSISLTQILFVYDKLVSHKLSYFWEKYIFSHAHSVFVGKVRAALMRCLQYLVTFRSHYKCRDGVLYCSARLQCSIRYNHSRLLFKLKYGCVGGSVLSICRKFLSNRRQRVVVDGATNEWIPIVSGVTQGNVLGPLMCILHISEMFELMENRLYGYAEDSTLLAVVRKPANTPAVDASHKRDFARI